MKKFLIAMTFFLCLSSFVSADLLDNAVTWMYNNKLTIFNNKTDFNAERGLRRDEAAKFYVKLSKLLLTTDYVKTANECSFSDINESWADLQEIVVESCRLGLFKGYNGKFNPKSQLTNAQAIAVLVRLLAGAQSEEGVGHRANNYYTKANELGILENVNMESKDSIATRGNVGIILYNGSKPITTVRTPTDQDLKNIQLSNDTAYTVKTEKKGLGETIYVYADGNQIFKLSLINTSGRYYDIRGNILFVDYGTAVGGRVIKLMDVSNNGKVVFETGYNGSIEIVGDKMDFAYFFGNQDSKQPKGVVCDNYEEIKNMGGSVIYEQKRSFNFKENLLTNIGDIYCSYGE